MDRSTPRRAPSPAALLIGAAMLGTALLGTAGCSSSTSSKVSSVASSAASAVQSGASRAASAANSVASQAASGASGLASSAASAASSAGAAASSAIADITGGLDATGDVKLGTVSTAADGRTTVPLTVTNGQSDPQQYAVRVEFKDSSGKVQDTVVVSVPSVAPGQSAQATARSNRTLSGTVTASVANAVRY